MSRYYWELEAVLEGKFLQRIDERENLAELAMNVRYTMNSEKVNPKKVFNKRKEESEVRKIFKKENPNVKKEKSMAQKIKEVNEYFRKKGATNE